MIYISIDMTKINNHDLTFQNDFNKYLKYNLRHFRPLSTSKFENRSKETITYFAYFLFQSV